MVLKRIAPPPLNKARDSCLGNSPQLSISDQYQLTEAGRGNVGGRFRSVAVQM